jgi:hypothetical protein
MTSSASICSVTLIVPILDVMKDPFSCHNTEMNVGQIQIIDCRVAKPIRYFGIKVSKLSAV